MEELVELDEELPIAAGTELGAAAGEEGAAAATGEAAMEEAAGAATGAPEAPEAPDAPDAAAGATDGATDGAAAAEAPEAAIEGDDGLDEPEPDDPEPDEAESAAGAVELDPDEVEFDPDDDAAPPPAGTLHFGPVGAVSVPLPSFSTEAPGSGNCTSWESTVSQSEVGMFALNMPGKDVARSDSSGMPMVSLRESALFADPPLTLIDAQFMYISRFPILLNQVQARV